MNCRERGGTVMWLLLLFLPGNYIECKETTKHNCILHHTMHLLTLIFGIVLLPKGKLLFYYLYFGKKKIRVWFSFTTVVFWNVTNMGLFLGILGHKVVFYMLICCWLFFFFYSVKTNLFKCQECYWFILYNQFSCFSNLQSQ